MSDVTVASLMLYSERMQDHWWWRPGWGPGRKYYTWHFTFGAEKTQGDHALRRLVHDYQAHLTIPGLDLVPFEWLHLTLQGVGFADEVCDDDIIQVIESARLRCADLAPVTVTLGPARVRLESVGLIVRPADPIRQVRSAIRAAIADVFGPNQALQAEEHQAEDEYKPHVSIAYSNSDRSAEPYAAVLAPASVRVTLGSVELIVLRREEHVYRWSTRATVPLGDMQARPADVTTRPQAPG
jgi:2'-5' RNA ligase